MSKKSLPIILVLACSPLGFAQTAPAPVPDLEARKESVVNLEAHIAQREKRLAELGQDIVTHRRAD